MWRAKASGQSVLLKVKIMPIAVICHNYGNERRDRLLAWANMKSSYLLVREKFISDIQSLRKRWCIPDKGFPDNKSINIWREHLTANQTAQLKEDIFLLLQELQLAERWYDCEESFGTVKLNGSYMLIKKIASEEAKNPICGSGDKT